LLRAYRATCYRADGASVLVGRRSPDFDELLLRGRCRTATLITAYNPFSRRVQAAWNQRMQDRLRRAAHRWPLLEAEGSWRGWREAHLLLLGDPRPAIRLARRFRQNAVVVAALRQPARLVFLR
jgi:hypothetical protein